MSGHPNISTALARVVVDELVVSGVESVAICPGSRSGALAVAAAEHPDLSTCVFIDERSAGFFALGVARASGAPAAVISTSGTAVANFYPSVVEADMSCVPLVVVSSDRPPELRGVGANQTIDQFDMFGSRVRRFTAIEAPQKVGDHNEEWRNRVRSSVREGLGAKPGPVHINVSFREPTVPVTDDGRTVGEAYAHETPRLGGIVAPTTSEPHDLPDMGSGSGLVIAGDGAYDRKALLEAARAASWPVLGTALSGLRGEDVVASYHRILAGGLPDELTPEQVIAVGAIGPDPLLEDLIAKAKARVRVDAWGRRIDPQRNATARVAGDPVLLLGRVPAAHPEWRESWLMADLKAAEEERRRLDALERPTGGHVADALNRLDWGALTVASSLPIREVDAHLRRPGPVYANRGASGIDGLVSTALGVASVHDRALALAGDLSFLHDSNGFLNDGDHDLTFVVVDNQGGGLFDTLPQARHAPQYERLFVTSPRRDLLELAGFHKARVTAVATVSEIDDAVASALDRGGLEAVVVAVDRGYDAEARV